jgi:hypothetical protein
MPNVSILLGAGFSVDRGYPTAGVLNSKITSLQKDDFFVHTDGSFFPLERGTQDPCRYNSYYKQKLFTVDFIKFYAERHNFNYEEFFDYYSKLESGELNDPEFDSFCQDFRANTHTQETNLSLLSGHNRLFNQIIDSFLVNREGKKYYEPIHHCGPIYPGYTGFLNCLENWGGSNIVHIHTLNHDLFFEDFKGSDWIQGELSDGFEELGSPYYGSLQDKYKVRLSRFTNKYDDKYRLYKLHGSIDQYPFYLQSTGLDGFIKSKQGIGNTEFYKETSDDDSKLEYVRCWINYHSAFLSGTTSKILRYGEPYYKEMFEHFTENLITSDLLVIIGYGGADTKINELIEANFTKGKPIYLVEPFPHSGTNDFLTRFNAKLIEKKPGELLITHFL